MAIEPAEESIGRRPRDTVLQLESAGERLVCLYLARVPAAYALDIERDLRLDSETVADILGSLVGRGLVRKHEGLYELSVSRER